MHILLRGSHVQRLRLAAGLVLFVFAATHLFNHALGLVSLDAMQVMQTRRIGYTRSVLGSIILGGAFLIHVSLALIKLAGRTTLRMPAWEAFQIASGLAIPILLFDHVAMTRLGDQLFGWNDSYRFALGELWPAYALWQTALVLVVWMHACIGLHFWLRLARWHARLAPVLLALAVLLPALALAGFATAGRQVAATLTTPEVVVHMRQVAHWPNAEALAAIAALEMAAVSLFLAAVAAVAGLLLARAVARNWTQRVAIQYAGGPLVYGPIGATLLEISRRRRVPHASVCGGRARCSTCRVRVDQGLDQLPLPRFAEAVTLGSIGAPPDVRLACQTRPETALTVTRLVAPAAAATRRARAGPDEAAGAERRLAIMFLDVRGFTRISESRLPYDIVFVLNQFFGVIGAAIEAEGGWIDKYLGDGLLAVFGRDCDVRTACRQALRAARRIDMALDDLNARLMAEFGDRLDVGIGIHAGSLVLGRVGHAGSAALTVIGRTVNTAARLEALTKDKTCQLIVSRDAARAAGWDAAGLPAEHVQVRGATETLGVIIIARGRDLPMDFATATAG
jgi:adenylate cyclase